MVRAMNSRVVAIVLLSLFVTCFVGSLAFGALALVEQARTLADDLPTSAPEPRLDESLTSEPDPSLAPEVEPAPEPVPEDEALPFAAPELARGQFAVFHVARAKVDPWKALQKAAKGTQLKLYSWEAPEDAVPPYLVLQDLSVDDYAVITGERLDDAHGLGAAQQAALPDARRATVIDFVLPRGGASLLEVLKVMAALTDATGGVLWDEESQEYFSSAEWRRLRVASWEKGVPQVSRLTRVHESADGDELELRLLGLTHLGLPELRLPHVAPTLREQGGAFLLVAAQQLVEAGGDVAPGRLTVRAEALSHGKARAELDPYFQLAAGDATPRTALVELEGVMVGPTPVFDVDFKRMGTPAERAAAGLGAFFSRE